MRATLFSTLLITALAACPMYARPGDGNGKPPGGGGGGQRPQRGEQRDNAKQDADVDLSPWIQAWAREGVKGKALTQRLERLMARKRAGKLPPPPDNAQPGKQANGHRPPAGGDGFRPPFGRFGGPQSPGPRPGPGMRGGGDGEPGMHGGRGGMMRGPGMRGRDGGNEQRRPGMAGGDGGGPGMRRGPGMQEGPHQPQPQAQRDGNGKPERQQPASAAKGAGAPQPNAEAMRDIQAQLGKMRDELSNLERRLNSNDGREKPGEGYKPKNPKKGGAGDGGDE
jgi:hypothetical protein